MAASEFKLMSEMYSCGKPIVDVAFKELLAVKNHFEITYNDSSYFPEDLIVVLKECLADAEEYAINTYGYAPEAQLYQSEINWDYGWYKRFLF